MGILSIQIFKRCSGCGERFDDCTCPPDYSLDLCWYSCWKYKTKRCPYNATEEREVGICQYESVIGILNMTDKQRAAMKEVQKDVFPESGYYD